MKLIRNTAEKIIAFLLGLILFPVGLVISLVIKFSASGDILFWSKRVLFL